jgi:hypothetical protein
VADYFVLPRVVVFALAEVLALGDRFAVVLPAARVRVVFFGLAAVLALGDRVAVVLPAARARVVFFGLADVLALVDRVPVVLPAVRVRVVFFAAVDFRVVFAAVRFVPAISVGSCMRAIPKLHCLSSIALSWKDKNPARAVREVHEPNSRFFPIIRPLGESASHNGESSGLTVIGHLLDSPSFAH